MFSGRGVRIGTPALYHQPQHSPQSYELFVLVTIVTLLKTQLTISCLLCFALASTLISFGWSFENLICIHSTVPHDRTAVVRFELASFLPDGDVSRRPGDVRSPSARRHWEEEALGRFEATMEASGPV